MRHGIAPVASGGSTPRRGAVAALHHPRFRIYSAGVLFSLTGNWVEAAAFGYVVLLLGGSPATLGFIGFLNTIPNLVWGLPAGVLADRYDRRRLLLGFQAANMAVAVLLAVLWQTGALTVPLLGAISKLGVPPYGLAGARGRSRLQVDSARQTKASAGRSAAASFMTPPVRRDAPVASCARL